MFLLVSFFFQGLGFTIVEVLRRGQWPEKPTRKKNDSTAKIFVSAMLKSEFHVLNNFYWIKIFPNLVRENTNICVFGENK